MIMQAGLTEKLVLCAECNKEVPANQAHNRFDLTGYSICFECTEKKLASALAAHARQLRLSTSFKGTKDSDDTT